MSFQQLIINIDSTNADKLSDIFLELNALSVSVEDEHEGTPLEQPIFDEPGMVVAGLWEHSKVVVLFSETEDITKLVEQAQATLEAKFDYTVEVIDDQDWVRLTQSQFNPIKVNQRLYIVPSWHQLPEPGALAITLDPGLAFGTGSHPTTFMCFHWITDNIQPQHSVLDYGCGSGILAIAAKKCAASLVYGVDIDEQAIESSRYNAQENEAAIEFFLPSNLPQLQFDVVIANILSNPLRILAPALAALTKHKLILSGILETQTEELSQIYSPWFKVQVAKTMEGWVLLECIKK
ncbi:MAG: 50S ribosomal protein L11 methyltransferase [Burkholderiales bacterium]